MAVWQQTVIVNRDQMNYIHSHLQHGMKRELADHLQMKPALLSRYLNYRNGKCFEGFKMPRDVYEKVMQYCQSATIH